MRFIADGPDLPDDLLIARDQGRVVFICGAGVSLSRSRLPDFWGLAESVANELGILPEETISQIISTARNSSADALKTISADRLFGLIEQDFEISDIYSAVAKALKPKPDSDLSAHQILLDLATSREGLVRIVTTNFDLLFSMCDPHVTSHKPPRLPDPKRPKDLNGIVYLHGCVNSDYSGAEADGFVLSSSEFGQAYLAEGWATSFIKEIINNYIVIFVGYSADDPPMQYLLEALRKVPTSRKDIYAFHSSSNIDGYSHWKQKGVIPIVYNDYDKHKELWDTLEAWAGRARNPTAWYNSLLNEAMKGPSILPPHVRGQIAHMVSTYEGMKIFSTSETAPPGEWLSVFDPQMRFEATPKRWSEGESDHIQNIDKYRLDSDEHNGQRRNNEHTPPTNAWNAFTLSEQDHRSIKIEHVNNIGGERLSHTAVLLPRFRQLAWWISRVCDQFSVIEWAVRQKGLHPDFCALISSALQDNQKNYPAVVRQAWHYILESKPLVKNNLYMYGLQRVINIEGWSERVVRSFASHYRPHISTDHSYSGKLKPNDDIRSAKLNQLIRLEVKYEIVNRPEIAIPNNWKPSVVSAFRDNLQLAIQLETEINGLHSYNLRNLHSLHREDSTALDYSTTDSLSSSVYYYSELFIELAKIDKEAALSEFQRWPTNEDTIFARLRIWVASDKSLVAPNELVNIYLSLSNDAFWQDQHQRDFLITLKIRWSELDETGKTLIEDRILSGPDNWGEEDKKFERFSAYCILERLHWLNANSCELNCDLTQVTEKFREIIPEWTAENSTNAARSNEAGVSWVHKNKDHSSINYVSLDQALPLIEKLSGISENFTDNDPFLGLVETKPVFAFRILSYNAKYKNIPSQMWDKFLSANERKNDSDRFVRLVAERISSYSPVELKNLLHPISNWISDLTGEQYQAAHSSLIKVISKTLDTIRQFPDQAGSTISRPDMRHDWIMDSINSPVGKIVRGMFLEPGIAGEVESIPPLWLERVDTVLSLPEELLRHALVLLNRNLNWFFHLNPEWTENTLIPYLTIKDPLTRSAAWAGILWSAQLTNGKLFNRLKSIFLNFADLFPNADQNLQLAKMILAGWASIDPATNQRYLSDNELISILLRNDEKFREKIISSAWQWARISESKERWRPLLTELLRVWPRRKSLKSANTTGHLLRIAFDEAERFPEIVELIIPLVTRTDPTSIDLYELASEDKLLINNYPTEVLDLLYVVLPSDANRWPYEMGTILTRLETAKPELRNDGRLIELTHIWQSR